MTLQEQDLVAGEYEKRVLGRDDTIFDQKPPFLRPVVVNSGVADE